MDFTDKLIISRPLYISDNADPKCGYCNGKKDSSHKFASPGWSDFYKGDEDKVELQSSTVGFNSELVNAETYDKLCNLGFRRSGSFMYKTDMLRNCCRLCTIRTNEKYLTMSKELKTSLKRFKKKITSPEFKPQPKYVSWIDELCDYEPKSTSFKAVFEPAEFTDEKYDLYVRYQHYIHSDEDNTPSQFESFLCDTPFTDSEITGTEKEWEQLNNWHNLQPGERVTKNGPAHECYYHNGKLIALSVLDFLPSGVSSVYFIWDPDYYDWSLGKVSALRELALVSKIGRPYYYLGYYIDDCPKMNYKAKFGGEILDVCNQKYVPLSKIHQIIKHNELFVGLNSTVASPDSEILITSASDKINFDEPFINAVDDIYGPNGNASQNAITSVAKLRKYGINYSPDLQRSIYKEIPNDGNSTSSASSDKKDVYRIPNVVPGLVPLMEIVSLFESGKMNELNNNVVLFDTKINALRIVRDFISEKPEIKTVITDVIRLIGLDNTKKAIIII